MCEIRQLVVDAERWNRWAAKVNARAVASGLVTTEEVAQGREQAQDALARLRGQLG